MNKSKMWEKNLDDYFSKVDDNFLTNFRKLGHANGKLTSWNANEPSSRWFKFLLFNRVKEKSDDFFLKYKKIGNTSLGHPIHITFNQIDINLDYLLAIEEFDFLYKNLNLGEIKKVVEIGAGFGRTVHVILSLLESIESYTIIDLPELIELSKKYLKSVLNDHLFSKISFIPNTDNINNFCSDLVININSFQEMTTDVIDFYMSNVIIPSDYFFSRNAVSKYEPSIVNIGSEKMIDVLELGYCREVINIFDDVELEKQIQKYIENYKPSNDWSIINGDYDFFPYYYNILYKKIKIYDSHIGGNRSFRKRIIKK